VIKTILKIASAFDFGDALVVIGVVSLVGGIAVIHRPSAAIVFGVLCIAGWLRISSARVGG
jgi:hypothetical protein